ncbi:MAG: carbon-nitrogen hydrolase family protein [Clostridiales bacterium]|nr:carbon-nitrogen hydrolase family protein [Clostridiales bacterium]
MKIALVQMPVSADKTENLSVAAKAVAAAAGRGAELVLLPEMFCCPYDTGCFPVYGEPAGGPVWQALRRMAAENQIYLVGGSMPELEGGKVYNTSFVFSPAGEQVARHRKAHLFDIDVTGGQRFMESDTLSPGTGCTVFDTPFGRFGLCICFDIRFPALAREMTEAGARAILVPAAFNMTTGPLHWELLLRARAVDNQLFVAACAPARDTEAGYVSYGHSLVADPWGQVLADGGTEAGILAVELDFGAVNAARRQIPVLPPRLRAL